MKLREDWLTALVSVNTLPVSLSRVKCAAYTRHKNLGVTCHPPSAASTTSLGDTQTQWSTALGPAPSTGGKIHSGNFTLHRADRAIDISTGLLFNWNCKSVSVVKQSVWTRAMRILEMGGMLSIHH